MFRQFLTFLCCCYIDQVLMNDLVDIMLILFSLMLLWLIFFGFEFWIAHPYMYGHEHLWISLWPSIFLQLIEIAFLHQNNIYCCNDTYLNWQFIGISWCNFHLQCFVLEREILNFTTYIIVRYSLINGLVLTLSIMFHWYPEWTEHLYPF